VSPGVIDISVLAREMLDARTAGAPIAVAPTAREGGLTLDTAYAVESELARLRRASGGHTVGYKVGFANRAMWRVLKLQTLVWAHVYDDTVHFASGRAAALSIARMIAPRIEPEVVFKLKGPLASGDPVAALDAVEWVAPGFEIVDCPFPNWTFQPADFVASFGLHAALVVGEPRPVTAEDAERLPALVVGLSKDGEHVEDGRGANVLRSPLLCLAELAAAMARRPGVEPLGTGDVVTTGSMTAAHPISAGERWTVGSAGAILPSLTLDVRE
jgi:2-keto-4-pentenoate hydratase